MRRPSPPQAEAAAAAVAGAAVSGPVGSGSDAVLRSLREATVIGAGRVVYSSNAVFLLQLDAADPDDQEQPLRAIYKPVRGERPLWDFPHGTLHLREVAAYLVSAALGDGMVPPTALRHDPYGPGSAQLFVDPGETRPDPAMVEADIRSIATLDVLLNNADRKRAHLLVGRDGRLRAIDNALSFLRYPRQRTVLIELGGTPLPTADAERVAQLAAGSARGALIRDLRGLLSAGEVAAFEERLDALAASPVFPRLDPWDGRPFEWW